MIAEKWQLLIIFRVYLSCCTITSTKSQTLEVTWVESRRLWSLNSRKKKIIQSLPLIQWSFLDLKKPCELEPTVKMRQGDLSKIYRKTSDLETEQIRPRHWFSSIQKALKSRAHQFIFQFEENNNCFNTQSNYHRVTSYWGAPASWWMPANPTANANHSR